MLVIEALGALQFLKKELISLTDLAQVLSIGKAAMSARVQRKNELKPDEIEKINNYYDVDLNAFFGKNAPQSPSAINKDEVIKIVEDYLIKRDSGLGH